MKACLLSEAYVDPVYRQTHMKILSILRTRLFAGDQ